MISKKLIEDFYTLVLKQDKDALRKCFHIDAVIYWHNSNEKFSVEEYLIANCEYPGNWDGEIERIELLGDLVIAVARIHERNQNNTFRVTSFIQFKGNKIMELNEYWGNVEEAPAWRREKNIGVKIKL